MRTISADIVIDAPAPEIWDVLADFRRYREWNPFIREAEGSAVPGRRIAIRVHQLDRRPSTFKPRILVAEPGRELRWRGHVIAPGVFDGEHAFELAPVGGGAVRVTQSETFSGLLVPFFGALIEATADRFDALNHALKARVESCDRPQSRSAHDGNSAHEADGAHEAERPAPARARSNGADAV